MSNRPKANSIRLSFRTTLCQCGVSRETGTQCAECGRLPDQREVDPTRQRRQGAARAARARLASSAEATPYKGSIDLLREVTEALSTWVTTTWRVLDSAAANPSGLEAHAKALAHMKATLASHDRRRPWLALVAAIGDMVILAEGMFVEYLKAISANTRREAQKASEVGQRLLDQLAEEAARLSELVGNAGQIERASDVNDAVLALARIAVANSPTGGILDAERRGAEIYAEITDRAAPDCPSGVGLWLLLLRSSIQTTGDWQRFVRLARRVARAVTRKQAIALDLVGDPSWCSDIRHATESAYDAAVVATAVLATARGDRLVVDALMEMAHALVESVSRPQVATLNAIETGVSYSTSRARDAGTVLRALTDKGFGDMLTGLSAELRTKKAHREYRASALGVTLLDRSGGSAREMSADDLIDSVLAGHETVAALTAGLVCGISALGLDVSSLFADPEEMPWQTSVQATLELHGWTGVSVAVDNITVVVTGAPSLDAKTAGSAFIAAGFIPISIERLRVESRDEALLSAIVPLGPVRSYINETDQYSKQVRFVSAMRSLQIGGLPAISDDQFRLWASRMALFTLAEDVPARLRRLKLLYDAARIDADEDLTAGIRGLMSAVRAEMVGTRRTSEADAMVNRLVEYSTLSVDSPFE